MSIKKSKSYIVQVVINGKRYYVPGFGKEKNSFNNRYTTLKKNAMVFDDYKDGDDVYLQDKIYDRLLGFKTHALVVEATLKNEEITLDEILKTPIDKVCKAIFI